MPNLLHKFRLNLGLKRLFIYHPVSSKVLTLLHPRRLRLPQTDLATLLGRPSPTILHRHAGFSPMNTEPSDLVPLCTLAAALDPRRILEVGCNLGHGTINLALACPEARVVTYDINPAAGDLVDAAEPPLRRRIEKRLISFPADSARLSQEPPYDFIFIDGDHTAAGVQADTDLALRLIAPGGVMAWHDYDHKGHEWLDGTNHVPEVLNALGERLPLKHLQGTMLVVWRNSS